MCPDMILTSDLPRCSLVGRVLCVYVGVRVYTSACVCESVRRDPVRRLASVQSGRQGCVYACGRNPDRRLATVQSGRQGFVYVCVCVCACVRASS